MQYVDPVQVAANAPAMSNPASGVAGGALPPPNPDDPNTLVQGPITWWCSRTTLRYACEGALPYRHGFRALTCAEQLEAATFMVMTPCLALVHRL